MNLATNHQGAIKKILISKIYETIRKLKPDFFIHSGDSICADGQEEEKGQGARGKTGTEAQTPTSARTPCKGGACTHVPLHARGKVCLFGQIQLEAK
jgi:hypothetical protein